MTKVTQVTARAVRVPLSKVTRQSTRTLDKREYVIVRVEAEDAGHVGVGYTYAGTSGGRLVAAAIEDILAPALLGHDAEGILASWDRLYQEALMLERRGLAIRALSGIDIALRDLSAKRAGMPLAVLLGGVAKTVPAYASGGYYRPDEGSWTDAVVAEIRLNRSLGFRDHKIKVGGLSVKEDSARVSAAADAIGVDGRLAIDANNAYSSVRDALRAIRAFEEAAGALGLCGWKSHCHRTTSKAIALSRAKSKHQSRRVQYIRRAGIFDSSSSARPLISYSPTWRSSAE
jgi:L-alanine-DL-glutamate epimerase-like enolase superfamily enzyme